MLVNKPVADELFSLPSERRPGGQETEEDGDRPGVPAGEGDGQPAPRDGRRHAGAGGRPAAEADGPRAGDAEQSVEPAGGHERADQPREPRETPGAGGQDTVEVPVDLRTVGALTETRSRAGNTCLPPPPARSDLRSRFFFVYISFNRLRRKLESRTVFQHQP